MNEHTGVERRDWMKWIGLWLALAGAYAALRSFTFFAALVHDDGLFLYTGQAWAAGELPYRDFYDHKPPGLFFFLSLPCRLTPFNLFAVKLASVLWLALGAVWLYRVSRKFAGRAISLALLPWFVLYTSAYATIRTGGLTEESALPFLALAYGLSLNRTRGWRTSLWAGLAFGAAIQFRQTFALSSLFLYSLILLDALSGERSIRSCLSHALALSFGMLIPELFVSLYFALNGAWTQYFKASYLANFVYVGARPHNTWSGVIQAQREIIESTGPYLLAPLFAVASLPFAQDRRWRMLLPLLAAFSGDLLAASLSGEYYSHYYVQAAVSIHLLFCFSAQGFVDAINSARNRGLTRPHALLAIALTILTAMAFLSLSALGVRQYVSDYMSILHDDANPHGTRAFQRSVADAAAFVTEPDERILLVGQSPNSVYFLASRYAGSRYYHYSPLWKEKLADVVGEAEYARFLADLHTRRPALILVDLTRMRGEAPPEWIETKAPGSGEYIKQNYTPLHDAPGASIPDDEWFWYDIRINFWIRNDLVDRAVSRLHEKQAG
ncbi:MAG: hypothetical protein GC154_10190 [bacterium]|nr:hypothetical protein [bacterium]